MNLAWCSLHSRYLCFNAKCILVTAYVVSKRATASSTKSLSICGYMTYSETLGVVRLLRFITLNLKVYKKFQHADLRCFSESAMQEVPG